MFAIGEYIIYGTSGICQVDGITTLDMSGIDKDKEYYILRPIKERSSTIYCPTDNTKVCMRKVITKEEAYDLIESMPTIEFEWIENDKAREEKYKESIKKGDCVELIKIIKGLYTRKQKRLAQGKKNTATNEKYFKIAEDSLFNELAFAIGKDRSELQDLVSERFSQIQ